MLFALTLAVSCGDDEPVEPTPAKDTKAPVIKVSANTVNVIAGPAVTISGNELKIGDQSVASWEDDVSSFCTVALSLTPTEGSAKSINS